MNELELCGFEFARGRWRPARVAVMQITMQNKKWPKPDGAQGWRPCRRRRSGGAHAVPSAPRAGFICESTPNSTLYCRFRYSPAGKYFPGPQAAAPAASESGPAHLVSGYAPQSGIVDWVFVENMEFAERRKTVRELEHLGDRPNLAVPAWPGRLGSALAQKGLR